jgi:catechol 2,3-dioxygenase-like lactoylglutathione lyase family enzyme
VALSRHSRRRGRSPTAQGQPPWRGFHHLALVTPDLDATIRFYRDVLGLAVTFVAPATDLHGRHAGLAVDGAGGFLHFFEQPGAAIHPYPLAAGLTFPRELGALLALPDEAAGLALRERLQALQIPVTEIMDQGPIRNMLFPDNNGLRLEAAWSPAQPNPSVI